MATNYAYYANEEKVGLNLKAIRMRSNGIGLINGTVSENETG